MSAPYNRIIWHHVSRWSLATESVTVYTSSSFALNVLIGWIGWQNFRTCLKEQNIICLLFYDKESIATYMIVCSESYGEEILMKCFDKCGQSLIKLTTTCDDATFQVPSLSNHTNRKESEGSQKCNIIFSWWLLLGNKFSWKVNIFTIIHRLEYPIPAAALLLVAKSFTWRYLGNQAWYHRSAGIQTTR